ncbi:Cof-type HAD-IIB family hydrolase [Sphingomonas sp. 1P08PE]|uniref:Cof-type HAD-IIB family hydrolase n=1 Tax=Sphingomonas sp. 1P08PE TaxID=554122 RepID=UPI0039A3743D
MTGAHAIRLLVSDVDGTLVDKQKHLTDATVAAVRRLEAAGIGFTIISARPRSGIMPLVEKLGLDVPVAAFNGGLIFKRDGWTGEHHVIDPTAARGTIAAAADMAVDIWVFARDRWYASTDQGVHVEHERVASNQAPIVTQDFDDLLDAADKITFVTDDAAVMAAMRDRCRPFDAAATIAQSQTYYLDVTATEANKGAGIAALAAAFDVTLADTAAIGDQANDLPMLTRAGHAIAMGNAPAEVQQAAHDVTLANDADGVAYAIDNLILSKELTA